MEEKDKVWLATTQLNRAVNNLLDQYQGIIAQFPEMEHEDFTKSIYEAARYLADKQDKIYASYKAKKEKPKIDRSKLN